MRPKVVAFDIIETVFSLESMRTRLELLGLPASAMEIWFATGLRDAFALALTDRFALFPLVLKGALLALLHAYRLPLDEQRASSVLEGMKSLDPHPDAHASFKALSDGGFRLVAVSNGARTSTEALLRRAKLDDFVEQVISVEDVGLSKPRPEVYRYVAHCVGVDIREVALAATHAWDTHGAKAAGMMTAFVARGQPYPDVMLAPDIRGQELTDVANALLALP